MCMHSPQGADVVFSLQPGEGAAAAVGTELSVFTTRPDTLFGVTHLVGACKGVRLNVRHATQLGERTGSEGSPILMTAKVWKGH